VPEMTEVMPLKSDPLNVRMFNILKKMIIYNEFEPGARLVIKDLCNLFRVSSSPVRDALHFLESDGLVKNDGNCYHVLQLNETDVTEIYSMRKVLEPYALDYALPNMDKRELRLLMGRMEAHGNALSAFEDDMAFHSMIIEACDNSYLKKELYFLANQSYHIGFKFHTLTNNRIESNVEHIKVIKAVIDNQPTEASDSLREHLDNSMHRILKNCFGK